MACEPTWSISSGSRPLKNGCALRNVRLSTVCGSIAYSSYILSRMVTHCSLTLRSVRIYFTRIKLPFRDGVQTFCASLLDNLVRRGQQRFRDGEAERLGHLQIDDQFHSCGLLQRQVGRLRTGQNPTRVYADHAIGVRKVDTITYEAASCGELAIVDRGHCVSERQRDELFYPAREQ